METTSQGGRGAKRLLLGSVLALLTGFLPAIAILSSAAPAGAAPAAAFTTTNAGVDGPNHCLNGGSGGDPVNCNIYDTKDHVWLGGGPATAALGDGSYFFAVLDPGGQQDPNDGGPKNLSDLPTGDVYTSRQFSVSGGVVTCATATASDHSCDGNKIRLMPYDDTANPGGVYILAVCSLGHGYPVTPSTCKYDAFKVKQQEPPPCTVGVDCPVIPAAEPAVTKDATGAYTQAWTWGITKAVDKTKVNVAPNGTATFDYTVSVTHVPLPPSGITVTGTIDVTNPNFDNAFTTVPMQISSLTDQLSDGTTCTVTGAPTAGNPVTLSAFDNLFPYTCLLSALPTGGLNNLATAGWAGQTLSNGTTLTAGTTSFTFSGVAFAETAVDASATITDTLGGTLGTVSRTDPSPVSFPYSKSFTGDPAGTCTSHDNTATFTTSTTGTTGSDSKLVSVCVGADLTVAKTALPAFTRGYLWSVSKAVDKTLVQQIGGTATFTYTVDAAQTGFVDSGWNVTGVITITNPNDWEAITADVTDAIDNGGTCTVVGGSGVTVPAGGSVERSYTCTYPATGPSPAGGTNTATATWDASGASTASGSATGTAGASLLTPTTRVHQMVTVTDTFNGGSAGTLGMLTATDGTPFTTGHYSYARTVGVPAYGCVSYGNTATIVETAQTASATVRVCGPARTGALTMGFWQNKNGQGIITGGASTAGICKSGTWLRTFAPFQDLSATATCAQVASYDLAIFKAANASGSAMNAMLKSQMLATAFDVYFSDLALGGNKIAAPGPIGAVAIDLTKICKMISASGGTSTCGGSYEVVSAAFGGANSLTVSQMLAYAAGQSNVGGGAWYGQVKATQGLAKDAFDAINNSVAFGP